MQIAFIGLGVMGRPMARHLANAGHTVRGYDPAVSAVPGITCAASAADAVGGANAIISMLPHGGIVREVIDTVAQVLPSGSLWIDCSSAEPWLTRDAAECLTERGVSMVDAPVSGAEWGAEAAELVFMCGGTPEDLARARPLLDIMGRAVFHLGPLSSGHAMKAINNVITANIVVATAEAMQVGIAHGLDPWRMVDVLDASTGGSWWSRERLRQDVLDAQFADGFKLGLMLKDVGIADALAREKQLATPMLAENRRQWQAAQDALGGERAVTEMSRFVAESVAAAPFRGVDNGSSDG